MKKMLFFLLVISVNITVSSQIKIHEPKEIPSTSVGFEKFTSLFDLTNDMFKSLSLSNQKANNTFFTVGFDKNGKNGDLLIAFDEKKTIVYIGVTKMSVEIGTVKPNCLEPG
jgi:hypothetical protein